VHRVGIALALVAVAGALFLGACGSGANRLAGTSWVLATLDGRGALPQTTAWLRFDEDGRFGGSTGCNSLGGTWKSSGSDLSFGDVATTLIGCPSPVGEQEAAFNAALGEVRSYSIEGGTLTLRDSQGASRMTFEPLTDASPTP
jgi:heat shock protein HslJ